MTHSSYIFEGSSYEIGQQHAAILVEKYQEARQALENSPYRQRLKRSWFIQKIQKLQSYFLTRSLQNQLDQIPAATDYLNGMLSLPEVTRNMYYFLLLSEVIGADRTGVIQGCSGVGFLGENSTLLGKNFDYQYPLASYQGAIIRQETSHSSYIAFAPVLMPFGGQFCVNEHRLAVSYNYAYYRKGFHLGGLPASYLVHDICRSCHNAEEAISFVKQRSYPIGNGASLAIVDSQNFYIAEVAGNHTGVIQSQGNLLHTNHFMSDELAGFNFPQHTRFSARIPELEQLPILESSQTRLSKLQQQANQIDSVESLQILLAERADQNGMNNVFQTGPFWGTISSYIFNSKEMKVYEFKDIRTDKPKIYDIKTLLSTPSQPICSQK